MNDDTLRDLYQEVILDHGKNPRHFEPMQAPSHEADGHNPLCGDHIHLFLKVDSENRVSSASFQGKGCAISIASASLMTDIIIGKETGEARTLATAFYDMAKGESARANVAAEDLERLQVLSGVSQFPMRVKCATLAWHTFEAALEGGAEASTE